MDVPAPTTTTTTTTTTINTPVPTEPTTNTISNHISPNDSSPRNIESNNIEDNREKRKRFIPPTLEEVSAYCRELNSKIDPQQFIDYYTANGWVQGKGKPIKDWKAAVRTWNRRENKPQGNTVAYRTQEPMYREAK